MAERRVVPGKSSQLLFDEDLELENQEEADQFKRRTAQIKRRQVLEAQRKRKLIKVRITIFSILLVLSLGIFSLRFFHVYPFGVKPLRPSPEQLQALTKQWVGFAVEAVEVYRKKNGKLPLTLAQAGIASNPAWSYRVLSPQRYTVSVSQDGVTAAFDSVDDPKKFLASLAPK